MARGAGATDETDDEEWGYVWCTGEEDEDGENLIAVVVAASNALIVAISTSTSPSAGAVHPRTSATRVGVGGGVSESGIDVDLSEVEASNGGVVHLWSGATVSAGLGGVVGGGVSGDNDEEGIGTECGGRVCAQQECNINAEQGFLNEA